MYMCGGGDTWKIGTVLAETVVAEANFKKEEEKTHAQSHLFCRTSWLAIFQASNRTTITEFSCFFKRYSFVRLMCLYSAYFEATFLNILSQNANKLKVGGDSRLDLLDARN